MNEVYKVDKIDCEKVSIVRRGKDIFDFKCRLIDGYFIFDRVLGNWP